MAVRGGGSRLNPAAPTFFPNHLQLKLSLNSSFHYCHLPPPFFFHPLHTQSYHFSPSYFTLPPPQLPSLTTEQNPSSSPVMDCTLLAYGPKIESSKGNEGSYSRTRFLGGRNGERKDYKERGRNKGFGRMERKAKDGGGVGGCANSENGKGGRRTMRGRKHAVVPVECDGRITTVMIRNIPNKYTREMLMEFLDNHCMMENENEKSQSRSVAAAEEPVLLSAYDFLYLPMDFQSGLNKGYAFVNFTDPRAVWKFHLSYNHQAWVHFNSKKRVEVATARIQGKDDLVRHFQRMVYPREDYSAVCFIPARNGSAGQTVIKTMVGICTAPATSN